MSQLLVALLPLYQDEDFILCDMPLAKGYALAHAIGEQSGMKTVWADEAGESQASQMEQARKIIFSNHSNVVEQ